MKKIMYWIILLFVGLAYAQENTYKITYENFFELSEEGLEKQFQDEQTRDFYREVWTRKKIFHLVIDDQKGHFSQEEHLEDQKTLHLANGGSITYHSQMNDIFLDYNQHLWCQPTNTKNLVVKDSLPTLQWKIERHATNVPQFFGLKTMKAQIIEDNNRIITAYYTPEIPISAGPKNYYGLPGLILYVEISFVNPDSAVIANIWQVKLVEMVDTKVQTLKVGKKTEFISEAEYNQRLQENMVKQREFNAAGVDKEE